MPLRIGLLKKKIGVLRKKTCTLANTFHDCGMSAPFALLHDFVSSFKSLLPCSVLSNLTKKFGPRGGGKPKYTLEELIEARVYHELKRSGTFSHNFQQISGTSVSDSALSQRLQSVGVPLFEAILPAVLKPIAQPDLHPGSFYHGYRLTAVDGVRFNLRNTEAMKERALKNPCSKGDGEPAFAQLRAVVLLELGHHQPLGASMGWQQEGEQTLYRKLFSTTTLPEKSLLMADQLYGGAAIILEIKDVLERTGSAVLFRAKMNLKAKIVKRLSDGSTLVDVIVRCHKTKRKIGVIRLREIRARITYEGEEEPLEIRFWTTLLDEKAHPAKELVELYALRWEEELFFRELKSHLHKKANFLDAQTPETAAQELVAQLLAASLIAQQRGAVADFMGISIVRISFAIVYDRTASLFEFVATGGDLMSQEALITYTERILEELGRSALIKKRPGRSCPRTVRQPVKDWPKTKKPGSKILKKTIKILNP